MTELDRYKLAYHFLRSAYICGGEIDSEDALDVADRIKKGEAINWDAYAGSAKEFYDDLMRYYKP